MIVDQIRCNAKVRVVNEVTVLFLRKGEGERGRAKGEASWTLRRNRSWMFFHHVRK